MKKILIVTSHYYPKQVIAAIRLEKRVKSLINNGYLVYVVTNNNTEPIWGEEKVIGVRNNIDIGIDNHKVKNIVKENIKLIGGIRRILKKIYQDLNIFISRKWAKKAFLLVDELIAKEKIDTIYVTAPDIETIILGNKLKKKYSKLKYYLEIRDILADNKIEKMGHLFNRFMKRQEAKSCNYVDGYIFLTTNIAKHYKDLYKINKYKIITNGYRVLNNNSIRNNKENQFIFSHIGSLAGSRNPINFIEVLGKLLNKVEFINLKKDIKFIFAGKMTKEIEAKLLQIINNYNLQGNVTFRGLIENKEALEIMFNSDINVLITHQGGSEYAIPGKLFEYIGAKKFILGITKDELVKEMINDNNFGYVVENDVDKINIFLEDVLRNMNKYRDYKFDNDRVCEFSQENCESKFIQFIN